ncbi:uncharacterized protein LOC121429119 [Lytechinus variegatus]|uniref:uncharacterized protein LOC121429119 n=1 Tax=Lytechinus variegatus TaxID=7654 RepID=UPI001BB2459C|nr:uncharacterized protein LOC121429119 [Lytechinus variegatus]
MTSSTNSSDVMQGRPRRLILWCLPRTGSTVLAKCLSFLDEDTQVWFEPYNLCRLASIKVKKETGHAMPKEPNEELLKKIQNESSEQKNDSPPMKVDPKLLTYGGVRDALDESERRTVVVKEMAVASYDSYDYIPKGYRHILVIRDPTRVISSFRKMVMKNRIDLPPDADLEKVHPTYPTHHWFGEMHALWKHFTKVGINPLIIDTEDFLANPKPFIKKICEVMDVEYRDGLLEWDASTDVIKTWKNGCPDAYTSERMSQSQTFKRAYESSGFAQTDPKPLPQNLTQDVFRIIAQCVDSYNEMYPHRFVPE